MSESKNNYNITFSFEEKDNNNTNEYDIQQMMNELNEDIEVEVEVELDTQNQDFYIQDDELNYFINKNIYGNDELFYEQEYTVKDLLKICSYYGIEKDVKSSKCKKQDIISTLVYFESLSENCEIVLKRNRMWAYIRELLNDSKMKKYIFWK
jgi:hypothetical protein